MGRYTTVPIWQKRIAIIVKGDDDRFYYEDSFRPEVREPSHGCGTRSEAMREAHRHGYTHASGLTTWPGKQCKRIPAYLRN